MTYVLYGDRGSGSFTPEALLAEVGAPVRVVPVNLDDNEQRKEEFHAVNPLGQLPTLVLPDGTVMTESAAIVLTIADRHFDDALLPPVGSTERAIVYRWLVFLAANVYGAVGRYDYPTRFTTDQAAGEGIRAAAKQALRELWPIVDQALKPAPFVFGERFCALDVYIANLSRWIVGGEWRAQHCPRLDGLAEAVAARPRIAPVWQAHFG
jgi:GST-like protein